MKRNNGLSRRLNRMQAVYNEYPRQFWVLIFGTFIDRLGGALLFPFFTLYITAKFGVGMTQVGVIFAIFSLSSVVGSMFGGALTDRLGRKGMLLFGLVASALSSLWMGVIDSLQIFYLSAVVVGLLTNVGGPAQQAMVADLLPEEQQAEGFGILRVVANLAVVIGPMIGGLMAAQSFLLLFVTDAVSSLITAVIVFFVLQESRPEAEAEGESQSMAQTFAGYADVLRDFAFVWFLLASVLMVLVYMQMNSTLAVYLRDEHGVTVQGFGYILSLNAAMVVLFQFPISRRLNQYRPLVVMTAGTLLYAIGFGLYGFVSTYVLFLVAMVIITVGEMFVSPVGQAIVARLAPSNMRGRYMAVYGFSWVIPSAVGPLLAGLVMDNANPDWVWYAAGIIGIVAAAAFYLLQRAIDRATWRTIAARLGIIEAVEEGHISAKEAAARLENVDVGRLSTLSDVGKETAGPHVRIRVSDAASGMMKTDLRLPVGLVQTVLYTNGQLAPELDNLDSPALRELLARGAAGETIHPLTTADDEQINISVE